MLPSKFPQVDANSLELVREFEEHYQQVSEQIDQPDRRLVFEAWVIQKISGLQIIVQELTEAINRS